MPAAKKTPARAAERKPAAKRTAARKAAPARKRKPAAKPKTPFERLCKVGKQYYTEYAAVYRLEDGLNLDILLAQLADTEVRIDDAETDWQRLRRDKKSASEDKGTCLRRLNDLQASKARLLTAIQKRVGSQRNLRYISAKVQAMQGSQAPDAEDGVWQGTGDAEST